MAMTATTISTTNGKTVMTYHNTIVASVTPWTNCVYPTGCNNKVTVELNTGGYYSVTTKRRMNQFAAMFKLPYTVYQVKGEFIVEVVKGNNPAKYNFGKDDTLELILEW